MLRSDPYATFGPLCHFREGEAGSAGRVHHVRQVVQRVILKRRVGAVRVVDRRQLASIVIRIGGVSLGCRPAIGQPVIGVVLVAQNLNARSVGLARQTPELVKPPKRRLQFAVEEVGEIARGIIFVLEHLVVGVGFKGLPPGSVVAVMDESAELICIIDESTG